jgi:tetratricopeptide (TPR) repeat protein
MKYLLTIFFTFLIISCFAQQITYDQWKEDAKSEIRLQPEYGHVIKNMEQLEADQQLIDEEVQSYGTHRKASDKLVEMGFNNIYNNDLKQAMYRFNQAWLLDPKNENVYWGFGAIYLTYNDYDEALSQYQKGLVINPHSSNILTDKATVFTIAYNSKHDINDLNKAIDIFIQSYKFDPLNQNTLFKLSAAYYYKQDCTNAWRYYSECMKLGGKPISPGYGDALKKLCDK